MRLALVAYRARWFGALFPQFFPIVERHDRRPHSAAETIPRRGRAVEVFAVFLRLGLTSSAARSRISAIPTRNSCAPALARRKDLCRPGGAVAIPTRTGERAVHPITAAPTKPATSRFPLPTWSRQHMALRQILRKRISTIGWKPAAMRTVRNVASVARSGGPHFHK
jgi:hypothetical protein